MLRRPPRSKRTDTLFPYTTLFRSARSSSICCSIDIILLLILRKMKSRPVAGGPGQPPRSGRDAGDGGAAFLVGGVERSAGEPAGKLGEPRTEERRVGKVEVSTCRTGGSP